MSVFAMAMGTCSFTDHFINSGRCQTNSTFVSLLDSTPAVYSAQGYLSQISSDG